MTKKYVYFFGNGKADGNAAMRELLGGKGANLAEMTSLGLPVPAGFTITTDVCTEFYENNHKYPQGLEKEVEDNLETVEKAMGAKFGDVENPLLMSVRSGSRVSMPGMMDTVLNIGLNDKTVEGMIKHTDNERAAYDSYRRFVQMYGDVVLGLSSELFEKEIEKVKEKRGIKKDTDMSAEDLKGLVAKFKEIVKDETKKAFPEDPKEQLWGAISAVFSSWNVPRAVSYRQLNNIPGNWGTAANVQSMVFGNMGDDSATGVAFTRDPSTGENVFYGEFLTNAQGEDVVAGIRTPHPLNKNKGDSKLSSLEEIMPELYKQLDDIRDKLEKHYHDMQDLEFTIQKGKLWILQTRNGKRTAKAAIRVAIEMEKEGLMDKKTAVMKVGPEQLDQLLHRTFDDKIKRDVVAKGLPASPGAASGKVVFNAEDSVEAKGRGEKTILVRLETSPDDIQGMAASEGILTARGGMTSHAAVVARGMGKCCVAGCDAVNVDYDKQEFEVNGKIVKKGDAISIDGSTGELMLGEVKTMDSEIIRVLRGEVKKEKSIVYQQYEIIMKWADGFKRLGVRANSDTPDDSMLARELGAIGVGLCRTEHMFFGDERLPVVQQMILADDDAERAKALQKLLPMQRKDFKGILKAMDGLPVIIRLLDPPLHEFLPRLEELMVEIKELELTGKDKKMLKEKEKLLEKVEKLHEQNPMLGHRGCRLGITFPDIYKMQVRAILEAAAELKKEGKNPRPEIMVPLVGYVKELIEIKNHIKAVMDDMDLSKLPNVMVGTMIELPRAAITADKIAQEADFFSFGTNDLTQTTLGFSRDDVEGKFIPEYRQRGILERSPFMSVDRDGVGELIKMGIEKGRKTNKELEIGVCGEHGGDPASIEFFNTLPLNYVSCSPYRVPVAILAAAQAEIRKNT
ncbi:MAG: pyruvate, phosphate dikinase [archaeon]